MGSAASLQSTQVETKSSASDRSFANFVTDWWILRIRAQLDDDTLPILLDDHKRFMHLGIYSSNADHQRDMHNTFYLDEERLDFLRLAYPGLKLRCNNGHDLYFWRHEHEFKQE